MNRLAFMLMRLPEADAFVLAVSTANLAFPSLLSLGRSSDRSAGIRLSGAVAAVKASRR